MSETRSEICLLNDSFPPIIDGVANVVVNYATHLQHTEYSSFVVTPDNPDARDEDYDFSVVRYPSLDLRKQIGYTAGNPFDTRTLRELDKHNIALLHSHCPMASQYLGRQLRAMRDVPLVMTYHTKYDIDIANALRSKVLQSGALHALVENVCAVDELWVVSKGAGENIRSLGYPGEYVVMENGVDLPLQRADALSIAKATAGYDLPAEVPVFLFVGRLMWYKGLRIILDAMAALKSQELNFRMVFIGKGGDEAEVKAYAEELNLGDRCIFTGAIYDRELLTAWYSRADLFLFPSTFDTNGLVVREAAASSLGTVMIKDSCASEGVTNGVNGLFVEENAASLAVCLARVMDNKDKMRSIGVNAAKDLYLSWEDAVKKAQERYHVVIENYQAGSHKRPKDLTEEMLIFRAEMLELYEKAENKRRELEQRFLRYM